MLSAELLSAERAVGGTSVVKTRRGVEFAALCRSTDEKTYRSRQAFEHREAKSKYAACGRRQHAFATPWLARTWAAENAVYWWGLTPKATTVSDDGRLHACHIHPMHVMGATRTRMACTQPNGHAWPSDDDGASPGWRPPQPTGDAAQ